jgi:outer membrane receptor protein involved in Fe transport
MVRSRKQALAFAISIAYPFFSYAGDAPTVQVVTQAAPDLPTVSITGARNRLDAARNGLSPDTGSTIYNFDKQDIANLPLGDNTPLNQVVLQAPGVVQDSYGQLHVRGDHANVQYRINGVVIPESISGFGQSLGSRFADHVSLLTGALPAQYGYRTAGVVDIKTKGAEMEGGGSLGLTLGSTGHIETSLELGGTKGALSYYLTGSYLGSDLGIENPTNARDALHDQTRQNKGFGYLSYLLNDTSRVSLMFGASDNRFQIPNVPGQLPNFTLDGAPASPDSSLLNANQQERNRFTVLSFESSVGPNVDYQISLFGRTTDVRYQPDPVGDLMFNGISADILRRNEAGGLQADMSWRLNSAHTLRTGFFAQRERFDAFNTAQVFPADDNGSQTSSAPFSISDNTRIDGDLWGVYLQDEWQPTKALTINYGLRYDKVHTVVDESQVSPRLGLVYDVTPRLRAHAGYARYFTTPPTEIIDSTSVQKFVGTTNALPSNANTSVKSERSDYYDLGLAYSATSKLTLGVDAYYRKVEHLQDEGQFGNALIYSAFNYQQGKIYGVELSANYRDKVFSSYANVAIGRAFGNTVETGQFHFGPDELDAIASQWVHLDHDQALTASAGFAYHFPEQLTLSGDLLYGDGLRRGFVNSDHLPAYTSVNFALAKTFDASSVLGKFDARVSVLNLFDSGYQLRDGSGIGVGAPQYGQRRTVYLNLTKSF